MAEKDVIAQLVKLSKQQRKILKMICDGNDYQTIAETFTNSISTIKTHVGTIYVKLSLDQMNLTLRRKAIFEVYCPALHEVFVPEKIDEPVESEPEPKPVPQNVQLMVIEDEKALSPYRRSDIITVIPKEDKPENLIRRRTINPLTIIVVLIVVGLAAFGVFAIIQSLTKKTSPAEINQSTLQQNNGISPTQIAVVPASTAVIPTVMPSPKPTATIPPSGVLFEDNFDAGLSPLWETISGEPMVSNGLLTASQETWVVVGDPTWTNYSVEYDAESFFNYLNVDYNVTAVRMADMDHMYASEWSNSQIEWHVVENGNWNEVPESNTKLEISKVNNFRITVNKNIITVYVNGIKLYYFVDSKYTQGRVGLMIHPGTKIDNFKVKVILD